jgi:transcriptional regulator with XRE-family HTH domain
MDPKIGGPAVGDELRERRVRCGLTLRRGAKALGMSMTELSAIEAGRRPITAAEFGALSAALRAAALEAAR